MFGSLILLSFIFLVNSGIVSGQGENNICVAYTSNGGHHLSGLYGYDEATRGEVIVETNTYSGLISKESCETLYNENKDKLNNQICANSGIVESVSIEWGSEVIDAFELDCLATCIDSDGGNNIYLKGRTKGSEKGTDRIIETQDYCISDKSVAEFYCTQNEVTSVTSECLLYGCKNGACIGGKVEDVEPIADEGFRYAKWECSDGRTESQGSESSCKSAELWKKYAIEFCGNEFKSFSVGGECLDDKIEIEDKIKCASLGGICRVSNCLENERVAKGTELRSGVCEFEGDICCVSETKVEIPLICKNSCAFEDSCLPIGVRAEGKYCSLNGKFLSQLEGNAQCDNSFECGSNVCVSGQCVEQRLIQKILDFFRRLFGGE